jgi:hypothetical protein
MTSLAPTTWTQAFQKTVKSWLSSGVSNFVSRFTGGDSGAASSRPPSRQGASEGEPESKSSSDDTYEFRACMSSDIPVDTAGSTNFGGVFDKLRTTILYHQKHLTPEMLSIANRIARAGERRDPNLMKNLYADAKALGRAVDTEVTKSGQSYASYLNPRGPRTGLKSLQSRISDFHDAMTMTQHDVFTQVVYDRIGRTARNIEQERRDARTWGQTIRDTVFSVLPFGEEQDELRRKAAEARKALKEGGWRQAQSTVKEFYTLASQALQARTKVSGDSCTQGTANSRQASKGPEQPDGPAASDKRRDSDGHQKLEGSTSKKPEQNVPSNTRPSNCGPLYEGARWDLRCLRNEIDQCSYWNSY